MEATRFLVETSDFETYSGVELDELRREVKDYNIKLFTFRLKNANPILGGMYKDVPEDWNPISMDMGRRR